MEETQKDYSKSVRLPETAFPMKAGLNESEPKRIKQWQEAKLYQKLRTDKKGKPRWILHDGPPFANGDIHMGTAFNKIVKDFCVRYKSMRGLDAPFVPGWDCHGLPIEFKVAKALGAAAKEKSPKEIRQLCAKEAQSFVERQREEFLRLGVWGDWEHPYLTMAPDFEAYQLDIYYELLKAGQIYRGLKPVHWCVYDQTALAEAELEYHEHESSAVFVKFPLEAPSADLIAGGKKVYAVIWTTTPWTLPANLAITVNERFNYAAYEVQGELWLLAEGLAPKLFEKLGQSGEVRWEGKGAELENLVARHPFIPERRVRFCCASYVSLDAGTGLVHTAPGHGTEDFATGSRYNLPVLCPVDAQGRYTDEFSSMKGQRVTDAATNQGICEILKAHEALILEEKLHHSYPHCWRCKQPIIFRATEQWFMALDANGLRAKVLEEAGKVRWLSPGGAARFANMTKDRADWCISRQRYWGVPIYMFYCEACGEPHFDEAAYAALRPIVAREGGDAWFDPSKTAKDFLPPASRCSKCAGASFRMERDTLDVWFDSGSSSRAVLQAREELAFPADLYVEGSDQYRGWFQSSMLVSCGVNAKAPYREVLALGWILDAKGLAMHKSAGNVVDPLDVMKRYGADILRLWAASEDVQSDLRFGEEILKSVADNYRRIRNSFRWLLGNLHDFEPSEALPLEQLEPLDRWLLAELSKLEEDCRKALDAFEFQRYYARLVGFFASELSSFVFDVHKDTLYTLGGKDPKRRSAQSALYQALDLLNHLCAPVLVFTADEVWEHRKASWRGLESVHLSAWPEPRPEWRSPELEEDFEQLLQLLMPVVKKRLEEARAQKRIGHPYDAKVVLKLHSKKLWNLVKKYEGQLASLLIVSECVLDRDAPRDGFSLDAEEVLVEASTAKKCARCWRRPGDVQEADELCSRCREALAS